MWSTAFGFANHFLHMRGFLSANLRGPSVWVSQNKNKDGAQATICPFLFEIITKSLKWFHAKRNFLNCQALPLGQRRRVIFN